MSIRKTTRFNANQLTFNFYLKVESVKVVRFTRPPQRKMINVNLIQLPLIQARPATEDYAEKIKTLSIREESWLALKAKMGDDDAKEKLIVSNMGLVKSLASRWAPYGSCFWEDLVASGNIALMTSVERFDPSKGNRFGSYAYHWIRKAFHQTQRLYDPIWVPEHAIIKYRAWKKYEAEHPEATPEEISEVLGIDESYSHAVHYLDLDEILDADDGESPMNRQLEDTDTPWASFNCDRGEMFGKIKELIKTLGEREQKIIGLRFGLYDGEFHTLEYVAKQVGVTRERIRQQEKSLLALLKEKLTEEEQE